MILASVINGMWALGANYWVYTFISCFAIYKHSKVRLKGFHAKPERYEIAKVYWTYW